MCIRDSLERADAVNRSIKAGRGLEVVAMSVLGLVGVVTMLQLLGLLGDARQRESDLLRARGASVPVSYTHLTLPTTSPV